MSDLEEDWRRLADASRNIFATWEFARTWWEYAGDRAEDATVAADDVVLPLVRERVGPLRLLRFVGHGVSDEQGPICRPEDRPRAAALLCEHLGRGGWDVFAGELLPNDPAWDALGATVASRTASPVVALDAADWEEYVASRSQKLRRDIRQTARRLEGQRFHVATAETLEDDLDALFALHRERWTMASNFSRHERFHRMFARVALEQGWLRLWRLDVDGEPAAAWYGFRFGNIESHYQGGRAARFDRLGVGLGLVAHTIREALEDGCDEYRFLQGDESYKFRFASDDPGLVTLVAARGAMGHAALGARVLARRLRRSLQRARPRRGARPGA